MGRPVALHGTSFHNSKYESIVTVWLLQNPRLSPGKLRTKLIEKYGSDAKFSEPTLIAWKQNFYPEILAASIKASNVDGSTGKIILSFSETELFGHVDDALSYHYEMRKLLETKMKEAMDDFDVLQARMVAIQPKVTTPDASDGPPTIADRGDVNPEDTHLEIQIIKTKKQVQVTIKDLAKEIRELNRYIDEYQKVHDYGERLGDLLESVVTNVYEVILPYVTEDYKPVVKKEFDASWKKMARDFGVPPSKVMA